MKEEIQWTLFNDDIDRYRGLLEENAFYEIRSLSAKEVNPSFRIANHRFELCSTRLTTIVPFDGEGMSLGYNFVSLKDASRMPQYSTRLIGRSLSSTAYTSATINPTRVGGEEVFNWRPIRELLLHW
ncbi:uncharacterized protein LOC143863129 [Tasmannia lanceolata]|uniref:uncharacterized protein LOC143863129 n=1 Tax=Tasmannia lanceolata TaxID=3420 RepID=UPI0040639A4F